MSNGNLSLAKNKKRDEFYTQYKDIENEISAYVEYDKDIFRNKIILCPCDDYRYSNFTKYFLHNFENFGLRRLVSTCYDENGNGRYFIKTRDGHFKGYLKGNGDYRNDEIIILRDKSDFIITNPPFSLSRDFLKWVVESNKKFSIIGNMNTIACKEVFPLFKNNIAWVGSSINSGGMKFQVPEDYDLDVSFCGINENGKKFIGMNFIRWFTNIYFNKHYEDIKLTRKYSKSEYPKYDNYDAIDVPKLSNIPYDYDGIMGVPITFLDKYNPNQFEIMGINDGNYDYEVKPTKKYINPIQHNKDGSITNGSKVNTRSTIAVKEIPKNKNYYTADNSDVMVLLIYARIFIRRKRRENENSCQKDS